MITATVGVSRRRRRRRAAGAARRARSRAGSPACVQTSAARRGPEEGFDDDHASMVRRRAWIPGRLLRRAQVRSKRRPRAGGGAGSTIVAPKGWTCRAINSLQPVDEGAVASDGDLPVRLARDVVVAAPSHLLEVVPTVSQVPDRARRPGRAAPAAPRSRTRPRLTRRAVSLSASAETITGRDDGHDPVEPAGHDVAGETRARARRSAGPPTTGSARPARRGWYGRKRHLVRVEPRARALVGAPRRAPEPTTTISRSSRSRRSVAARISVSRSCAYPTFPECMTTNRCRALVARPVVRPRHRAERDRCRPSSGSPRSGRMRALRHKPLAHRLADRDHLVGAPKRETDGSPERGDEDRLLEPAELRRRSRGRRPG